MKRLPALLYLAALLMTVSSAASAQRSEVENELEKCAAQAKAPAVLVNVTGFRGEEGNIRVQSYPATKQDWLEKGRWISRIDMPVKVRDHYMQFCLPVPSPGVYGIAVRHDRNGNGKTDFNEDGGGFSNNPSLNIFNMGKPSVDKIGIEVGEGVSTIIVKLKYF